MQELSLDQLIEMILPEQRSIVKKIIQDNKEKFDTAPGGLYKHQNWKGGYKDHIHEVMRIAAMLYEKLSTIRPLPFALSDALYTGFLHDLEKMLFTGISKEGKPIKVNQKNKIKGSINRTFAILDSYHISLTDEQKNAIKYSHGEGKDYHPSERIMQPLAAFVHCCDTISARIWFDFPKR